MQDEKSNAHARRPAVSGAVDAFTTRSGPGFAFRLVLETMEEWFALMVRGAFRSDRDYAAYLGLEDQRGRDRAG